MKTAKTYTFYFGSYDLLKSGSYKYKRDEFTMKDARDQQKIFGDSFARIGKSGKINIVEA